MNPLIIKHSVFDFITTCQRLKKEFTTYPDIQLIQEWDHDQYAKHHRLKLNCTKTFWVSHPYLDTPLIQNSQSIALDLPQKILVIKDVTDEIKVIYNNPFSLQNKHELRGGNTIVETWAKVLNKIVEEAIH